MSQILLPPDIQIPALQKKLVEMRNLMIPGPGTPWEDRGSQGVIAAFFSTCLMSLTSPMRLWNAIRRPETSHDAASFAFGCAWVWSMSFVLHGGLILLGRAMFYRVPEAGRYAMGWAMLALLPSAAILLLTRLGAHLYYKLIDMELRGQAPEVLTYNLFAYSLGPCALALVPFVGPPLAALWTIVLLTASGIRRQHISVGGSIIAMVLTLTTVALICGGLLIAGWYVWQNITTA